MLLISTCNTLACGGIREKIPRSWSSEERTIRHHDSFIQVATSSQLQRCTSPAIFCTMQHSCRNRTALPRFFASLVHTGTRHSLSSFFCTDRHAYEGGRTFAPPEPFDADMCAAQLVRVPVRVTRAAGTPQRMRSCAWRSLSWLILPLKAFCNRAFYNRIVTERCSPFPFFSGMMIPSDVSLTQLEICCAQGTLAKTWTAVKSCGFSIIALTTL